MYLTGNWAVVRPSRIIRRRGSFRVIVAARVSKFCNTLGREQRAVVDFPRTISFFYYLTYVSLIPIYFFSSFVSNVRYNRREYTQLRGLRRRYGRGRAFRSKWDPAAVVNK